MDDALRANRDLWDAWTGIHTASEFYDVPSFRDGRQPIRLAEYEREEIGPVAGKSLLHLQCHFGLDTLSWARLGANVTGADFSEQAITAARALAADVGVPATFVAREPVRPARGPPWAVRHRLHLPRRPGLAAGHRRLGAGGGALHQARRHLLRDGDPPGRPGLRERGRPPGELRLAYPYWSHGRRSRFAVKGSYADPDAPTRPGPRGARLGRFRWARS